MGKPRTRFMKNSAAICRAERKSSQKAVNSCLSMSSHPGLWPARGRGAGGICPRPRLYAGAGAGFLSYASTHSTVSTIRASIPPAMEPGLCADRPARKRNAARAHPVPSDPNNNALIHEALSRPGARTSSAMAEVPHPAAPRRGRKAPHPAQKQPAQKRPAQKRERPAEKKPAAKPRKAQPAAKEPRRAERGEAFGKPTAAQLRQAERYLKTRKKKQTVKKPTKQKLQGKNVERKPSGVLSRLIASRGGTF